MDEAIMLEIALKKVTFILDSLVGACMDEQGNPKVPDRHTLMHSRAFLPSYCKHAYSQKQDKHE